MLFRRRRKIAGRSVSYRRVTMMRDDTTTTTTTTREHRTRALVTGGSGCLGSALVAHLVEDGGYEVHSLDLLIPGEEDRDPHVSSYIQADVTNQDDLLIAFKGMDVVFHTAALIPHLSVSKERMYSVNFTGTQNVIAACVENGVERLVHTSSCDVALTEKGVHSDPSGITPPNTKSTNPYVWSKALAEEAVCKANGLEGVATCALRPGMILAAGNVSVGVLATNRTCYYDDGHAHIYVVPVRAVTTAHLLAEKKLRQDGCGSIAAGKAYFIAGVGVPF